MSMAEVYYQLVGSVDYLVGAEGFEPVVAGLTRGFLTRWSEHRATITTEDDRQGIVDDYVLYYFDYALAGLSVDLSAARLMTECQTLLADAIGNWV